ncbi:MAG: aspartyl protease family protein [Euryarchaeota archaeon]|nr:aspartyl protease family protein [Euryarchaeota archaeon]MDE1836934.1 aspartyl protease family protein [Euryarchaeota archaeon]MDE1882224.1 aspartyl protease family protein [Euryarchaeota archaeon]MDE2045080.1 aspartyl protease family protein [Thermoplasmata archaeon]
MAPSLKVRLSWGRSHLETRMVIDTGSTFSAVPSEVAEVLGLEKGDRTQERAAVGGPVPARASRVHLHVLSPDLEGKVLLSFPLDPILVTEKGRDTPVALLGRRPFFEHYDLILRERRHQFVLQEARD